MEDKPPRVMSPAEIDFLDRAGRIEKPPSMDPSQAAAAQLRQEPGFAEMDPREKTRRAYEMVTGGEPMPELPGPEDAAAGPLRGAKAFVGRTADSILGLPGAAYNVGKSFVTKGPTQTGIDLGRGFVKGAQDLGAEAATDPWSAGGKALADVAGMTVTPALARGAGAGLARRGAPLPAPKIPGAPTLAVESRQGFLPRVASSTIGAPTTSTIWADAVAKRAPAVMTEAERLMGIAGPEVPAVAPDVARSAAVQAGVGAERTAAGEARRLQTGFGPYSRLGAGRAAKVAVKSGANEAKAVQAAVWNPTDAEATARGVQVGLGKVHEVTQPLAQVSEEAYNQLATSLGPETAKMLVRTNRSAPLQITGSTPGVPAGISPEQLAEIQMQAAATGPAPMMSWQAARQARTKVGELLDAARRSRGGGMGNIDTATLGRVYGALTDEMKGALAEHPDLLAGFNAGNRASKTARRMYQSKGTMTNELMKPETAMQPSQVAGKVARGTPESARNLMTAMPEQSAGQSAVQAGVVDELFSSTKTRGAGVEPRVNFRAAVAKMDKSPAYKEVLGDKYDAFKRDLVNLAENQEKGVTGEIGKTKFTVKGAGVKLEPTKRAALEKLVNDAVVTEPKIGKVLNGPKLHAAFEKTGREALRKAGWTDQELAQIGSFTEELNRQWVSTKSSSLGGKILGVADLGAVVHGIKGMAELATGNAAGAGKLRTAASWLIPKRALAWIYSQPEGPHLLARAMKTGKWGAQAGKAAGRASQAGVGANLMLGGDSEKP